MKGANLTIPQARVNPASSPSGLAGCLKVPEIHLKRAIEQGFFYRLESCRMASWWQIHCGNG